MIIKFKKLKKYKLQMTQQGGQPVPTFEDDFVKNLPSFDFLPKTFVAYNGMSISLQNKLYISNRATMKTFLLT